MARFLNCIGYVLANEGGFSENIHDRGGATNFGITHNTLARFKGRPVSSQDIRDLTREQAQAIYWAYYWKPLNLDGIVSGCVAVAILDMGVNFGIHGGSKLAQLAAGTVKVDGMLGDVSIAAINKIPPNVFIRRLSELAYLKYNAIIEKNPSQEVFRHGWTARARRLLTLVEA